MKTDSWTFVGLLGQFFFFLRFLIQWLWSEKKGVVTIPIAFWYLSIAGAVLLGIYAWVRLDIVFLLGSLISIIIYLRNLALMKRN